MTRTVAPDPRAIPCRVFPGELCLTCAIGPDQFMTEWELAHPSGTDHIEHYPHQCTHCGALS